MILQNYNLHVSLLPVNLKKIKNSNPTNQTTKRGRYWSYSSERGLSKMEDLHATRSTCKCLVRFWLFAWLKVMTCHLINLPVCLTSLEFRYFLLLAMCYFFGNPLLHLDIWLWFINSSAEVSVFAYSYFHKQCKKKLLVVHYLNVMNYLSLHGNCSHTT